jgi:hypothetical protein
VGQPRRGRRKLTEELVGFGNIEVDLAARTLKRGDETLPLTTGEFAVLKVLLQHPRQPLSRDKLMTLARGREQGPFDRAIDVQVSRLRKLIESDPSSRATCRQSGALAMFLYRTAPIANDAAHAAGTDLSAAGDTRSTDHRRLAQSFSLYRCRAAGS